MGAAKRKAAGDDSAAEAVSAMQEAIAETKEPQSRIKGIAVLGSHPATVAKAPFHDPDWLIYACSPHNIEQRTLPRVSEWFEVHLPVTHPTRQYEYLRRLEQNNVAANPPHASVIWARDEQFLARCRDARPYPEQEMKAVFGPFTFTSSIAFMLAKAIVDCLDGQYWRLSVPSFEEAAETCKALQAKKDVDPFHAGQVAFSTMRLYEQYGRTPPIPAVGLWGIMQASETEYAYQRPGIQNLIWHATRLGLQILAPKESGLFEPPPENW